MLDDISCATYTQYDILAPFIHPYMSSFTISDFRGCLFEGALIRMSTVLDREICLTIWQPAG